MPTHRLLAFRVPEEQRADFERWAERFTGGNVGAWLTLAHQLVTEAGGPRLLRPGAAGDAAKASAARKPKRTRTAKEAKRTRATKRGRK